jgi:hypothetical protein
LTFFDPKKAERDSKWGRKPLHSPPLCFFSGL